MPRTSVLRLGWLLSAAALAPAHAQPTVLEFLDGADLLNLANQDSFAAQGYVTGVVDAALAAGTIGLGANKGHATICLPQHATQAELVSVVLQYVTNHADSQQFPAASDVSLALAQAYPCQ